MKTGVLSTAMWAVLATPPVSAFVVPLAPSLQVAPARTIPRNGRIPMTAQLAVTLDAAARPALPGNKRIVRRKKARPAAPAVLDIKNAPVKRLSSDMDYLTALKENEHNLVVIKFFAPWCRSCKAMDIKYRRLAMENENVRFFEIDVHESPELKKALGVKMVPFVKLHAGSLGQVASFACGPRKVSELARKMELCKDVPALAARVSKGSGMMEMVAGAMGVKSTTTPGAWSAAQDLSKEPAGIVKGLMEKLERQEQLSIALADD